MRVNCIAGKPVNVCPDDLDQKRCITFPWALGASITLVCATRVFLEFDKARIWGKLVVVVLKVANFSASQEISQLQT